MVTFRIFCAAKNAGSLILNKYNFSAAYIIVLFKEKNGALFFGTPYFFLVYAYQTPL